MKAAAWIIALVPALASAGAACAQPASPPADYVERVRSHFRSEAKLHDVDGDGRLTRSEVRGSNLLASWFHTMDINRDGVVSSEELERFLANLPPGAM